MNKTLYEIAEISAGQGAPQGDNEYSSQGTPFVKAGNLNDLMNGESINSIQKVSEYTAKKYKLRKFPQGTVVFAKSGMSCLKGYVYVLPTDAYVVNHLACIIPKYDLSEYLKFYFLYHKPNELIKDISYPSIRLQDISNIEIKIPEEPERSKIVKELSNLKIQISLKETQLKMYDRLIKSRFVEMFGDVTQKNNGYTINDVCRTMIRGPFGSSLKKEFFVPKGVSTYKVYEQKHAINKKVEIGEYYIDKKKFNELKRFEVQPGDVIMSCSGTIGELFVIPDSAERGIINQALLNFRLNYEVINKDYFLYAMDAIIYTIDSKGSGIENITSVSNIKNTNIYLPPLLEQNNFSIFVKQVDKLKFENKLLYCKNRFTRINQTKLVCYKGVTL